MNELATTDRFYYARREGIYRLECAGQITQVVNPPGLIESPEFVLYNTLENERLSGMVWKAIGLELTNGYGWIFERDVTPNDDDTEPIIDLVRDADEIRDAQAAHDWIIERFQPIHADDVVEMKSKKGTRYFGTVLKVDLHNCQVKVEYFHPTTREYWRGWRSFSEVTVIHTAKVAA